jgi:hypothetical protein
LVYFYQGLEKGTLQDKTSCGRYRKDNQMQKTNIVEHYDKLSAHGNIPSREEERERGEAAGREATSEPSGAVLYEGRAGGKREEEGWREGGGCVR